MIKDVIKETLIITSFVMVMMLVIEYINVRSKGNWARHLQHSPWLQLIFASVIGVIPGCFGAFVIVSLYTHNMISFGALVAALLASFGDEAYILFSIAPGAAIKLSIILVGLAIIVGAIVNLFTRSKAGYMPLPRHFSLHHEELATEEYNFRNIVAHLGNMKFERAILMFGLLSFIVALAAGGLSDIQGQNNGSRFDWITISFGVFSIFAFYVVTTVPDHFLEEHLWGHIIKKHFIRILLWTFGALLTIQVLLLHIDLSGWVHSNPISILFIALLIGIIPQSGPHIIFITLYFSKVIPFSILLANSIVQDGHGAIPLLAESKKSFVLVKLINFTVGLIVGLIGYYSRW
jgi:hypothetical protein